MMMVHEICFDLNLLIVDVVILGNRNFQISCLNIHLAVIRIKRLLNHLSHNLVTASLLLIFEH